MRVKDAVGRYGEQLAADHLEAAGLVLLARNWRCRAGELDIVARDGSQLVIAEVKTRSSLSFGSPAEAVGRGKSARIRQLALRWMMAERDRAEAAGEDAVFWSAVRFDVISIVRDPAGHGVRVDHLEGAF